MNTRNFLLKVSLLAISAGLATNAIASGLQARLESASSIGDANSGGAAIAEEASAEYYNPAGLVRIDHKQLVFSNVFPMTHTEFEGTATAKGRGKPPPGPIPPSNFTGTGTATNNASGNVPAFYFSMPLIKNTVFGFGINSPYGLGTDYTESSILRYVSAKSELETRNLSPGIGYALNDKFSVGAAFDAMELSVLGITMVRTQNLTKKDSKLTNDGSSWAYGWHGGVLYQHSPQTRVGLTYHSKVTQHVEGDSKFVVGPGGPLKQSVTESSDFKTTIHLPAMTMLSAYHAINPQWAITGTIDYTQWDVFESLVGENVAGLNTTTTTATVPQNFHNTWRYAVGAHYRATSKLLLRTGVAYDQTPTNDIDRSVNIPGADRISVGVGAKYQIRPKLASSLNYAHSFFKNSQINNTNTATGTTVVGDSDSRVDAIGLQLTWDIDGKEKGQKKQVA